SNLLSTYDGSLRDLRFCPTRRSSDLAVFAPPTYLAAQAGGNFVLVASRVPIPGGAVEEAIRARGGVEIGITGEALDAFVGDARPLTDDYAPVDQMIDRP